MTNRATERSDNELLALSVPGDRSAFEALIGRHAESVRRTVGGLLAWSNDVPDAVQDVWVTAWQRRETFEKRSTVRTWLIGIAIHVCRNRRRSAWRWQDRGVPSERSCESPDSLVVEEVHCEVRTALTQLSMKVREVAVLYYIEEMLSADIAAQLEIPINTVDKRLQRARDRLRILLQETQLNK